jgi:glycosyltransferase involved in cell wall biosynthesis
MRPKVLSTQQKKFHPRWTERTDLLPGWLESLPLRTRRSPAAALAADLRWAWRLFRASRPYPVVLTGSERAALFFALMQRLLRRRPVPHVLLECMWNLPEGGLRRVIRRAFLRTVTRSVDRIVVWSRRQPPLYEAEFGGRGKFVFLPFHTTTYGFRYEILDEPYLFSGGDSNRDYRTLIEAARGLPWRLVISARNRRLFPKAGIPENVEILTAEPDQFLQLMARAGIVVIPLCGGLLHSGGHQSYLNAMAMGKPVVVADDCGAGEYIEHGNTGMVVPPGDPAALHSALLRLIHEDQLRRRLAQNAPQGAAAFSLERYIDRVFELIDDVLSAAGSPRQ